MLRKLQLVVLVAGIGAVGCGKKGAGEAPSPAAKPAGAAPAGAYRVVTPVPGAGTVTGTVAYAGSAKYDTVKITKDAAICAAGGAATVPAGALLVSGGKLKNAVVMIEGITAGKAFASDSVEVDNVACRFQPHVAAGKVGGTVAAKNTDTVLHNTHLYQVQGQARKNLFNIALPNKGQTITKPLRRTGLIDVKCDAHEWMQGYVWVLDHPYAAITDAQGAFTMSDVPAGQYTARVWHEKLGEQTAKVTVEAGKTATLSLAFQ